MWFKLDGESNQIALASTVTMCLTEWRRTLLGKKISQPLIPQNETRTTSEPYLVFALEMDTTVAPPTNGTKNVCSKEMADSDPTYL
jgi:hypothetical protein